MAYHCCVADCRHTNDRQPTGAAKYYEGKFVKFPKAATLRNEWLKALRLGGTEKTSSTGRQLVCAAHFGAEAWRLQDVIMNVPLTKRRLKPDAVPMLRHTPSCDANILTEKHQTEADAPDSATMDETRRKQLVAEALAAYEQSEDKNLTPSGKMPQKRRRVQVASRASSRQFEKIAVAASMPEKPYGDVAATKLMAAHSSGAEVEIPLAGCVFPTNQTKKCGEIVVDIDEHSFALNCFLCATTCRELAAFVEHIRVRHASMLNTPAKNGEVKSLPQELEETFNGKASAELQSISAPAVQACNTRKLTSTITTGTQPLDFGNVPLIEHILFLYKQNRLLWDKAHPQHGVFRQRKAAIIDILHNLSATFPQISFAYKSLSNLLLRLRAGYRADLRHIQAPGRPPPNHWFFYKMREFLGEATNSTDVRTLGEQNLNECDISEAGSKPLVVHKCSYCGKRFPMAPNLKRHLRLHTNERPYVCQLCGAQFRNYSTWFRHGRTHTKLKPYRCGDCQRCYYTPSMLRLHQKSHLGIRDKVCDICGKSFTHAKYLYRHRAVHRKKANKDNHDDGNRKREMSTTSRRQPPLNAFELPSVVSTNQVPTIVKVDKHQVENSSDGILPPVEDIFLNLNIKGISFVKNCI